MKKHIFFAITLVVLALIVVPHIKSAYFSRTKPAFFDIQTVSEKESFVEGKTYSFYIDDKEVFWKYLQTSIEGEEKRAVFLNEKGEEVSFYPHVFFTVSDKKDNKVVRRVIQNSEIVVDHKELDTLNMHMVGFEKPYEAYKNYLSLYNDSHFKGVGLDFHLPKSI